VGVGDVAVVTHHCWVGIGAVGTMSLSLGLAVVGDVACHIIDIIVRVGVAPIPPLSFLSVSTPIPPNEQWLTGWVVVLET
jgi:hypothetical protein